ncbi:L,D-transpeptidase [Myxococcota bacterium]|nr:L,D-transpeptidase [Myxococcota bacterium]
MKIKHLLISILSMTLLNCSSSRKKEEPTPGDGAGKPSKPMANANANPNLNGEGEPIPSPLGPIQKLKKTCKAPVQVWGEAEFSLPQIASILPPSTRSLKAKRKTRVYRKPDASSYLMGIIKQYSRLPLTRYAPKGKGCETWWLAVGKDRYVCGSNLKADNRSTLLRNQPILEAKEITPHRYGRIRKNDSPYYRNSKELEAGKPFGKLAKGDMISLESSKSYQGKRYWITAKGFLVWDSDITGYKVPRYHGINLRKLGINLPVALIRGKTKGATVYEYPGGPEKKGVKPLPHYSARAIYDKKKVKETGRQLKTLFYRVKEGWIKARRVLSAWPTKPPVGLKPCEKWIEINVSMQTMVAYEGEEPVYMAPISSGNKKHPTKYGIFRIWLKKANGDMTGSMANERYRVDEVPWSMFFYLGQALHAAYWHTNFGNRKSHGCVNLTPIDAKWFYEWTEPAVPAGWLEVNADESTPVAGTLVVVRHKYEHEVPYSRYARKLAPPEEVERLDRIKKDHLKKQSINLLKNR